jgi:hypothetical protein
VFILRWIVYACAFVVGIGLPSIVLGGLNELFAWGIWEDDYPGIFTRDEPRRKLCLGASDRWHVREGNGHPRGHRACDWYAALLHLRGPGLRLKQ